MTTGTEQALVTEAWYYTRMLFARGLYGSLRLRDRQLSFVTVADASRSSSFYERVDPAARTTFDLPVDRFDEISYNWLLGTMTLTEPGRRHIVSFAGPPSGSHSQDARRLISALQTLGVWRARLGPVAGAALTAPQRAASETTDRSTPDKRK